MSTHASTEQRAFDEDAVLRSLNPGRDADLLLVSLRAALVINRTVVRALVQDRLFDRKADESPATATDRACEGLAREIFADAFGGSVAFMGEEGGGAFATDGYCAAVDPIDGTWGFIGDTGTFGSSIGVYKDGKPHVGVVSQPTASEMMYAIGAEPTRLLRAERWGMQKQWQTMPQVKDQQSILVNMQWQQGDARLVAALGEAWARNAIQQARSTGGSPAVNLAEVAKGSTLFASNWKKPATPYDLGAGMKIVENAGGSVVDSEGNRINPIGHAGIFVAGLRKEHQRIVREILRSAC